MSVGEAPRKEKKTWLRKPHHSANNSQNGSCRWADNETSRKGPQLHKAVVRRERVKKKVSGPPFMGGDLLIVSSDFAKFKIPAGKPTWVGLTEPSR